MSLAGRVVNAISPRQRNVAMVFQNYALYPHLSVAENIGFALANKGVPRAERDRRVREAAAVLGLSDLLGRKPRQLSGGQRQRVAMGRAIVREPAVFLMDEPLSSLDAKLRVQMRSQVLRVHKAIGAATLYVTHDQVEAMTMGDRIAVLHSGVLQQYGPPRELYARPANLFVAQFIGSPEMNVYQAAVDPAGCLVLGSQRLPLGPRAPGPAPSAGREVIVGVRPEDLTLGPADGAATLAADIRVVEQLGSELHAIFSIDAPVAGARELAAAAGETDSVRFGLAYNGVARLDPRTKVRPGDRVTFGVDTSRLHFFDPATGASLPCRGAGGGPAPPVRC